MNCAINCLKDRDNTAIYSKLAAFGINLSSSSKCIAAGHDPWHPPSITFLELSNCKCKCKYLYIYVCTSDVSMRFGIALSWQSYVSFPESLLRCLWSLCCALLIRESALSDFVNIPSICFHICSVYNLIGAGSICGPIGFVLEKLNREIKTRYTIYMCGHSIYSALIKMIYYSFDGNYQSYTQILLESTLNINFTRILPLILSNMVINSFIFPIILDIIKNARHCKF